MDFPLFTDRSAWNDAVNKLKPHRFSSLPERVAANRRILGLWLNSAGVNAFMSSTKDLPTLSQHTTPTMVNQGIHAIRSILATEYEGARNVCGAFDFRLNGYLCVSNLLGSLCAELVAQELHTLSASVHKTPSNLIDYNKKSLPECWKAMKESIHPTVLNCLGIPGSFDSDHSAQYLANTFGQRVLNSPNNGDIQKHFHIDTFFPALKFWYFPEAVEISDGPLRFAPGSHKLTEDKLIYMQTEYVKLANNQPIDPTFDYGHMDGSLRITEEAIVNGPYRPIRDMIVPADTLIVADVFAWHARGEATKSADRIALHGSIRSNYPLGNA